MGLPALAPLFFKENGFENPNCVILSPGQGSHFCDICKIWEPPGAQTTIFVMFGSLTKAQGSARNPTEQINNQCFDLFIF